MTGRCQWCIAVVVVLLWLAAAVSMPSAAGAAGVPIEGVVLVQGWAENGSGYGYFMNGASNVILHSSIFPDTGDISPDATKVAYSLRTTSGGLYQVYTGDVWVAKLDGSDAVNLTGPTGIGGVNCCPTWSPDGRMIAFQHTVPVAGKNTCEAGFQVWLINSDGTNFHQWLPSSSYATWYPSWFPDGYRISCYSSADTACVTADITGLNVRALSGVNGVWGAKWSRDGSKVAYIMSRPDTVAGESGVWGQICLADPDGSNTQVLVQQFVKDADISAHLAKYNLAPSDFPLVQGNVVPKLPRWSPLGDQVVFLAAMPFDPNGPDFWYQIEVWLYDLKTKQLTRLTSDTDGDAWLSWAGPNTSSASPRVTVYGTSVTFSQVNQDGWTSITRTEDLPALPTSCLRLANFYQITSTAEVTGPATVAMSYADAEIAAAAESHIAMLRYNAGTAQWEDITMSRDAAQKVITGQSAALGLVGLAYPLPASDFSDVTSSTSDPYWALWEIEAVYAAGIVKGYDDGTYKPTDPVTRDQMAVYMSRALAGGDAAVPTGPATATFPDVATDYWAFRYIEYAVDQDVVKGYDDGTYKPADQVDRGQMSVFVARAVAAPAERPELPGYTPPITPTFPDVPTSFWAFKYVEYIAQDSVGVTKGYPDGDYHPEYVCTRDQMAVYVARAFKLPL